MSTAHRIRRRSKGQIGLKEREVFGFSGSKDRIQSLVSELHDDESVTIITRRPLSGHEARLQRIDLSELGDEVITVLIEGNDAPEEMGKAASIARSAFEPDARARAMLRGVEIAESDLAAAGGAFDLQQLQRLLHGLSRQRIERRVREGTLLAVVGPSNRRRYPTIQFNRDGTVVEGLKEVRDALNFESPWSVLNFLVHPDDRLNNRRPIDLLRAGDIAPVLESARRVGVQGG
jgi:hypothetical protein